MKKGKRKVVMKKNARRVLVFGFFSVFIIISVFVSVLSVVREIVDKYREEHELEQKMVVLKEDEEALNNEIIKLQDSDYLARYAREKYFYSKDGELIIRIPNQNND